MSIDWLLNQWQAHPEWVNVLHGMAEITILTMIIYFIYVRFIRKSHAEQLLKGLFIMLLMFVGLWGVAFLFGFQMLERVFAASIQILFIGLIVIFQPELRRMLLFLGQGEFLGLNAFVGSSEEQKAEHMIHEIGETVHFLSKSKRGALIVLEAPSTHGGDYLEVGTTLDAKLSTELMLTIFHPNTPLHDGAVVVSPENRIVAAGVLLPLTEDPKLSWQYGTRHRAAIGLTEISDSRCIVVSEETGAISLVEDGKLEKIANAEELRKTLARLYQVSIIHEPQAVAKKEHFGKRLTNLVETLPDPLQRMLPGHRSRQAAKITKSGTNG